MKKKAPVEVSLAARCAADRVGRQARKTRQRLRPASATKNKKALFVENGAFSILEMMGSFEP